MSLTRTRTDEIDKRGRWIRLIYTYYLHGDSQAYSHTVYLLHTLTSTPDHLDLREEARAHKDDRWVRWDCDTSLVPFDALPEAEREHRVRMIRLRLDEQRRELERFGEPLDRPDAIGELEALAQEPAVNGIDFDGDEWREDIERAQGLDLAKHLAEALDRLKINRNRPKDRP